MLLRLQAELDRFCNTLIAIRGEIAEIEEGKVDRCAFPAKPQPSATLSVLEMRH